MNEEICEGDTLFLGNDIFTVEGNYAVMFTAQNGCDSIVDLSLGVISSTVTYDTLAICEGDSIEIMGTYYKSDLDTMFNLSAYNGCDSLANISIRLQTILEDMESIDLCEGDSILLGNIWLKEEGIFSAQFTSTNGCDSIFTYDISILPKPSSRDSLYICKGDSIEINDQWYSDAGQYDFRKYGQQRLR